MTINTKLSINHFTLQQEVTRLDLPKNTVDKINHSHGSRSLELRSEELQYLSDVLDCCRDIQRLTLIGDLEFLPDEISHCSNLRELSLRSNKLLKRLPDAISRCREIEVLSVYETELESLPHAIGNCHNLQELLIRHSKLKYLPSTLGNCKKLREINLNYNQLECLPESIGNCFNLERLTFTHNKIKYLPKRLDNCEKLRFLQLDYNQFEHLSEVIPKCTNLRFLGMEGNNWKTVIDMTLLLSTMTNLRVIGLPPFVISEKKSPSNWATNNKSSYYDIVIVNPVCKGFGDYELGRKIHELASRLDYSVKIQMTTEEPKEKLKSRLIIITPYSINDADHIQKFIKDKFFINRDIKVLLIDEMDAEQGSERTVQRYKESLQKISVNTVDEVKIGFSTNSVGYLSMTREECQQIQRRSRVELEKLFDSFNVTLDPSANYYLNYLNSEKKATAVQIFIFNTLRELEGNPSSVNYICSLGETATTTSVIDISNKFKHIPVEYFSKDAATKFSKISLMMVDVYAKRIFQKELTRIGRGAILINIIFLSTMSMPRRVWHNFIAASKAGMMTGDQSLSDYLSIKQEMPFYETQNWKTPLKYNILKKAKDFKGEDFKEYVTTKFVGEEFSGPTYKVVDEAQLTDELRSNFRDFGRELAKKAGNYACTKKIVELAPKKSIYSATLHSLKKLFTTDNRA